jgi:hypothetical protein
MAGAPLRRFGYGLAFAGVLRQALGCVVVDLLRGVEDQHPVGAGSEIRNGELVSSLREALRDLLCR